MNTESIQIRPLRQADFDAVVDIDTNVFHQSRPDYYEMKFARALDEKDRLVLSFVAQIDKRVIGFVMCELYVGEYGIPATTATLDTIGVHPDYQRKGVSRLLMDELISHMRKAGVKKITTLVDWNDWQLIRFFSTNGFEPAKTMHLELKLP